MYENKMHNRPRLSRAQYGSIKQRDLKPGETHLNEMTKGRKGLRNQAS